MDGFLSWKLSHRSKWMMTGGTPILGNLHMIYGIMPISNINILLSLIWDIIPIYNRNSDGNISGNLHFVFLQVELQPPRFLRHRYGRGRGGLYRLQPRGARRAARKPRKPHLLGSGGLRSPSPITRSDMFQQCHNP